jgi:ATP-dependent Lhr-like helicase
VQLIGHGLVTCDSFGGLRRLVTPPSRRRGVMKRVPFAPAGRWSRFRAAAAAGREDAAPIAPQPPGEAEAEFAARHLLTRYGLVFRRLIERERIPVPWRDIARVLRREELRGEVRGGRFVGRFAGEQFALPEAVELMRRLRRSRGDGSATGAASSRLATRTSAADAAGLHVSAADPLNLEGILTPEPRVSAQSRRRVQVA